MQLLNDIFYVLILFLTLYIFNTLKVVLFIFRFFIIIKEFNIDINTILFFWGGGLFSTPNLFIDSL